MALRKMAKGYMTIEAVCIVTWTVFLLVFLIYLSFYSYDKCVLYQDSYAVCFRGSIQKDEGQIVPYIHSRIQEQFGKKYFGVGTVTGTVNQEGKTVSVMGECQVQVPVHSMFTMSGAEGWRIRTQARAQIINPTKQIRKYRMIKNAVEYLGQ